MGRTVADAAVLMGVLESASPDPNDAATQTCTPPPNRDYTAFLDAGGAEGRAHRDSARVLSTRSPRRGIAAAWRPQPRAGQSRWPTRWPLLKAQGAVVVDPADVPSVVSKDPAANFLLFDYCQGAEHKKGGDANCTVNFKYGMKRDFNAWLASLGPAGAGEDAHRTARVESRACQGGCDALRPVTPRHLGRDGRGARSREERGRRRKDKMLAAIRASMPC